MARIFIDTDELRDVARDLRRDTGELGPLLGRLGNGFRSTWMPVAAQMNARWEGQSAQLRVLGARVDNDARSLDAEALRVEALEAGRRLVGSIMAGVRWSLRTLVRAARWAARTVADGVDWATRTVVGVIRGIGRFGARYVLPVWAVELALVGSALPQLARLDPRNWWLYRRVRSLPYRSVVHEPPLPHLTQPPLSEEMWRAKESEVETRLRHRPGFGSFMAQIGAMTPGTIVVIQTGDDPRAWAVLIRGIDFDEGRGFNNLPVAAGEASMGWGPYEAGIMKAMAAAGVRPGDGVALIGHSQGAFAARNLAADRIFVKTFDLDLVVTGGAGVDNFPVSDSGTSALHVSNTLDPVAATHPRSTFESLGNRGHRAVDRIGAAPGSGPFSPHGSGIYAERLTEIESQGDATDLSRMLNRGQAERYRTPVPGGVHIMSLSPY